MACGIWNMSSECSVPKNTASRLLLNFWKIQIFKMAASGGDLSWYFSQVKGTLDDDVAEGNLDIL